MPGLPITALWPVLWPFVREVSVYHPLGALFVGAVAGIIFILGLEWESKKLGLDDALGVWPLHGLCGTWGGLAAGIFSLKIFGGKEGQDAIG